jgi:elongation factor Ts
MAQITAEAVKQLRDRTGMQMMKCKAALTEAGGDLDRAVEILRKQNKEAQDKSASRATGEGRIGVFIDPAKQAGGIVEVLCETAPVAKNELFIKLANDLARQVASEGATTPEQLLGQKFVGDPKRTVNERVGEVVGLMRENIKPARMARLTGLLGDYVHHDGSVGVLLQVEGQHRENPRQVLRDVCMHIAARSPKAALREHLTPDVIAKEKEIARAQLAADPKSQGKPAQILEKILEGKLKAWYQDNVLHDQLFVKDDTKTVGDLLRASGLKLVKFIRYKVGEQG